MSSNTSKDLLVFELFQNKDITYSTIDSLLKYGFDSNESLLSLDFDLVLPQMPDICLSQKCLLRQVLVNFRKNYRQCDDWTQEKDSNLNASHESEDSLRENKLFDQNSNEIFFESESIVRSIKEQLLQQNQSYLKQEITDNYQTFELSFEPIVDQLRESLIRVEKQKQEKDLILQKQRIELKIKELEIQRLQNEKKQLESQLICEKLKVEKLDYKLKSNNISNNNKNIRFEDKFKTNNNCIKSLDDFKAVYYNSVSNNSINNNNTNNDSDCDQQSSGYEDQSPIRERTSSKSNFVNYWTEVETNPSKTNGNKNLDHIQTTLFTEYVSKHSAVQRTGDSQTDNSVVCIELDSSSNDNSSSAPVNRTLDEFVPKNRFKRMTSYSQRSTDGEEEEEDVSETEQSPDISSDFGPEVESIVCEPDIDCDTNQIKTSFKQKNHFRVQNNRIVINSSEVNRNLRPKVNQSRPQTQQNCHQIRQPVRGQTTNSWKQFQCDYENCSFSFVSSEGLKRHIRSVHTKEKPYKCHFNDCQKCFGRSDALKEHMKRHLGLKLFKCSYSDCDFESVSSNSLKRHVVSIHLKEKHFKCLYENCGKTFGRKDSLKKHMEKQHLICDTNSTI